MKLNQKLAKSVLSVALSMAMVVTSLFVMPVTANAATGATIGHYNYVKTGATVKTTVRNLSKTQYAKVSVSGTAVKGITVKKGTAKVTSATKIQGTGKNIVLSVSNKDVTGKSYALTIKTYNKSGKLVKTYTTKSTFVYKATTGIVIKEEAQTIAAGATFDFTAVKTPADSTQKIVWTSSDEKVATVDAKGVVTGVADGKATITAKSGAQTATVEVTVNTVAKLVDLKATGAKTLTATLSAEATVTAKDFTVKKGTAVPNIVDVKADKTSVVITLGSKMTAGTYEVTYKDVTKTVEVKDETLTTLAVIGTNLAEIQKAADTGIARAGIYYQQLNQYGERMTQVGNVTVTCSFGQAHIYKVATLKADGTIIVENIPAALAVLGTAGSITLVDSQTGVHSTANVVYSATPTISEIAMKGVYNTSTGKFEDLTAGVTVSNYVLVLQAKTQYGNVMTTDQIIAEKAKISVSSAPVMTDVDLMKSNNPTNTLDAENLTTVTIDGVDYPAIRLKSTSDLNAKATAGSLNVTIVNNTKGVILSDTIKVAEGSTIKSIKISQKDTIYAGDLNELSYEVLDSTGKAVTSYEALSEIKISGIEEGKVGFVKQADGSAKLYYSPAPTGYVNNKATWKQSVIRTVSAVANYGTANMVLTTATFTVYTERKPVAITGYKGTTAVAAGKPVVFGLKHFVIEDQYGNAMSPSQNYYPKETEVLLSVENNNNGTAFAARTMSALLESRPNGTYNNIITSTDVGSATVSAKLGNNLGETYEFTVRALDPEVATDLKIADINYGYPVEVATGATQSGLTTGSVTVTGVVDGKRITLPVDQYTLSGDTFAGISASEGKTTKKAVAEVTVDTWSGEKQVSTVLTGEYEYSNKDAVLSYIGAYSEDADVHFDNNINVHGTITAADLIQGLYYESQYGGDCSVSGIKYSVSVISDDEPTIRYNNTNNIQITPEAGDKSITLSVTATYGDMSVTQTLRFVQP